MIRVKNRLGKSMTLPITLGWRRVPFSIAVPTVPNARGDGSIVVGTSRLQPRQFTLSGSIYYPSRQLIRDKADELLAFLQHAPIEVYQWPDSERRLCAYPQGAAQDWMDAGAELGIDIPMLAPDPYWYGDEAEEEETDAGVWEIDVDGTAPTHPVVTIRVTSAGGMMVIRHLATGLLLDIEGTYQPGDVVTVDTQAYTARLQRGGIETPIIDRLGDEFVGHGFVFLPGGNALQYTGPPADVTITYRPRWY